MFMFTHRCTTALPSVTLMNRLECFKWKLSPFSTSIFSLASFFIFSLALSFISLVCDYGSADFVFWPAGPTIRLIIHLPPTGYLLLFIKNKWETIVFFIVQNKHVWYFFKSSLFHKFFLLPPLLYIVSLGLIIFINVLFYFLHPFSYSCVYIYKLHPHSFRYEYKVIYIELNVYVDI